MYAPYPGLYIPPTHIKCGGVTQMFILALIIDKNLKLCALTTFKHPYISYKIPIF